MSITVLADANVVALSHYLGAAVDLRTFQGRSLDNTQLKDIDALLVRSVTPVTEALLQGSTVKFVGTATSGFDHVDRYYLEEASIAFAHAPGSNANSVVEYVLAAIAEDGRKLEDLFSGARVGIIGCGNVGRALVSRLEALGIGYLCYDPCLEPSCVPHAQALERVLQCEVVSLHCELTRQSPWPSYHLIGQHELRRMSTDTLLINASRGSVIDNAALRQAFAGGYAPRTVLDVWEGEPDISARLLERVLLGTAHIAGYSLDGKVLATAMLCRAMHDALAVDFQESDPLPAVPPGVIQEGLDGAELVRGLLRDSYDIRRDDGLLREAVLRPTEVDPQQGFDQLRRNYGPRRELAGRRYQAENLSESARGLLVALGCECLPGVKPE